MYVDENRKQDPAVQRCGHRRGEFSCAVGGGDDGTAVPSEEAVRTGWWCPQRGR